MAVAGNKEKKAGTSMNNMKDMIKRLSGLPKEKNREFRVYSIICLIFFLTFLMMTMAGLKGKVLSQATHLENRDEEKFVTNLTTGMTIEQYFTSPHDFDYVTVSCTNHDMFVPGKLGIQVLDVVDNIASAYIEIDNADINYQEPLKIPMYETGKKDVVYEISILAVGTEKDKGLGFYGYIPENSVITAAVDEIIGDYALSVGTHTNTDYFKNLATVVFLILFLGLIILVGVLLYNEAKPEHMFLALAVPMAVALLCFMSVNMVHDGDAHFPRAYHYANMILGIRDDDADREITMRKEDVRIVSGRKYINSQSAQNMWHLSDEWSWFAEDKTLVSGIACRSAGTTNIIEYLPSVIGIVFARIIGLGAGPMILLTKILSFIFYTLGAYYAIKIIPVGRHLLVFAAALPMALQQATGITYDNVTLTVLFLFLAYALRLYFDSFEQKQWVIFTILCLLLGCCKGGIYTPMLIFLLFIPRERMGDLMKKALYITVTILLVMTVTLINYSSVIVEYINNDRVVVEEVAVAAIVNLSNRDVFDTAGIDAYVDEYEDEYEDTYIEGYDEEIEVSQVILDNSQQTPYGISFAFKNPGLFIQLLANTLMEKGDEYVKSMLGNGVAWAVEKLPAWSYIMFLLLLVLAKNGIGESDYRIDGKLRAGILVSTLLVYLVYHVLFLVETPMQYDYIWGIQGRYFIPQIVLLLLAFRNNRYEQESGTEKMLYLGYYFELMLFMLAYLQIFMTQTYL